MSKFIVGEDGFIDITLRDLTFKLGPSGDFDFFKSGIEVEIDDEILADISRDVKRTIREEILVNYKPTIGSFHVKPTGRTWTENDARRYVEDRISGIYEQYDKNELVEMIMDSNHSNQDEQLKYVREAINNGSVDDPELIAAVNFLEGL